MVVYKGIALVYETSIGFQEIFRLRKVTEKHPEAPWTAVFAVFFIRNGLAIGNHYVFLMN